MKKKISKTLSVAYFSLKPAFDILIIEDEFAGWTARNRKNTAKEFTNLHIIERKKVS